MIRTMKRLLAAMLWFLSGWTAGGFIAFVVPAFGDVGTALGPIVGAAAAGLFAGDPAHVIWIRLTASPNHAPHLSSQQA